MTKIWQWPLFRTHKNNLYFARKAELRGIHCDYVVEKMPHQIMTALEYALYLGFWFILEKPNLLSFDYEH